MKTQIKNKVKVGIVDDQDIFCKGLKSYLIIYDNIDVVVMATSGKEILLKLTNESNLPDILLLDIDMPEMDGLDLLKIIKTTHPKIKVIMLSMHSELVYIEHAIGLGANGYVRKGDVSDDIVEAINLVANNGFYLDSSVSEEIKRENTKKKEIQSDTIILTSKEKEVLNLICQQYSTKQIAAKLFITKKAVEYHRKNLISKTKSQNVVGLVLFAIKNSLCTC